MNADDVFNYELENENDDIKKNHNDYGNDNTLEIYNWEYVLI